MLTSPQRGRNNNDHRACGLLLATSFRRRKGGMTSRKGVDAGR